MSTMDGGSGFPPRRTIRLRQFDYSHGWFAVTICTHDRRETLGRIIDGRAELSTLGSMCEACWLDIPGHFAGATLDAFVIMPNHLHGILALSDDGTACRAATREAFAAPTKGSLPTVMRSFKSAVTKQARVALGNRQLTVWQRGYFERVIRDAWELAGC